jgi:hypothetical protein
MDEMVNNPTLYFRAGQVRHLPYPTTWNRCFGVAQEGDLSCPGPGTYQNGAYWATPLHYIATAMKATGHASFAESIIADAIHDFKTGGIYEDVDYGYPANSKGVLNYTVRVANFHLSVTRTVA